VNSRSNPEEDLRVIRTLMERATTYRAVAAPTALVGGVLALLSAAFIHVSANSAGPLGRPAGPREFAFVWIDALLLTVIANTFFLWREARNDQRPFISSGMKLALRAIVPVLIVPAMFTIWFFRVGYLGAVELELVVVWVVFYGLALLATAFFAPTSLVVLGWMMLLTGALVPIFANALDNWSSDVPNLVMGATFGVYHIIYALFTWKTPRHVAAIDLPNE
jgi:hypothetical protein